MDERHDQEELLRDTHDVDLGQCRDLPDPNPLPSVVDFLGGTGSKGPDTEPLTPVIPLTVDSE